MSHQIPPRWEKGPHTTNCALYHFVVVGEYCNKLVVKYSISLPDFLLLNPHVNANCTNLWKDTFYCVKAVGAIDQYPGHPDYVSTTTYATVPYGSLPKATYTPPAITGLPQLLPMAEGTRTDCFLYADGDSLTLPYDISSSWFNSLPIFSPPRRNPSLPVSSTSCVPKPGYRYCMAQWDGASFTKSPKPIETPTLLPIREGATPECKAYQSVITGFTCQSVLNGNGITIAQFYACLMCFRNPTVGDQCQGLWSGYRYCISITENPNNGEDPGPVTSSTANISSTLTSSAPSPTPPGPTQEGIAPKCNKWHIVGGGPFCYEISVKYGITTDQFYDWNPAVSRDCGAGFWG
ncbi:hypothetical protein PspLS_10879, partial [Pyricularia sp. CBS 133598]